MEEAKVGHGIVNHPTWNMTQERYHWTLAMNEKRWGMSPWKPAAVNVAFLVARYFPFKILHHTLHFSLVHYHLLLDIFSFFFFSLSLSLSPNT